MPAPGLRLTLLTGRRQLSPLDPALVTRLTSVSVTESDEQQSVFTLVFDAGRSRRGLIDVAGLGEMPIEPFSRVALVLDFGSQPVVLISGIVTQIELEPGSGPGTSSLRVSGEDLSFLLDRLEHHASYSQHDDEQIVRAILTPGSPRACSVTCIRPADRRPPPRRSAPLPSQDQTSRRYAHWPGATASSPM